MALQDQLSDILNSSRFNLSDILPADWAEQNMVIKTGNFPGRLSYDLTPYSREIINRMSPYDPANEIVVMGGAQWGKTKTIVEPALAYYISQHPCEMAYLTGHTDLADEAMDKLDSALDNSGLRPLIRKNSLRKIKRTGDTNRYKEFGLGSLVSGSITNHKLLRQRSWRVIIPDDIDAGKGSSKESGDTVALIRVRAESFGKKKKILWVSTPEIRSTSLIEKLFKDGDQRYYHIPCQNPNCGVAIRLQWSVDIPGSNEKAGIWWSYDKHTGKLDPKSVCYICQECGHSFTDKNKYEFNKAGLWIPSAVPEYDGIVSYHLSRLYSAPGMSSWEENVRDYLRANPPGQPVVKKLMHTFTNLILGESFEDEGDELNANTIQRNVRDYEIGIIPERLSVADGNGRVVLVTCGADLNGIVEDGRLDYEVVAWTENGSSYSIMHGSLGSFVPAILKRNGDVKVDREILTYEENKPNSLWPEFDKILKMQFKVDVPDGYPQRTMGIMITALDTGNTYKNHAYTYIDNASNRGLWVEGVKGTVSEQYAYLMDKDVKLTKKGKERDKLYILEVGFIKDNLAARMMLNWNKSEDSQPAGFMNFPHPGNGMYEWGNFFSHFEAEKRVMVANATGTDVKAQWKKKTSASQNHAFDCHIYNMAIKDIFIEILGVQYNAKAKGFTMDWLQYVKTVISSSMYTGRTG